MDLASRGHVFFTWGDELGHTKSNQRSLSIPCLVEALREHDFLQITKHHEHNAVLVDPDRSPIRQSQETSFKNIGHSDVVVFMVDNEPLFAIVNVLLEKSKTGAK